MYIMDLPDIGPIQEHVPVPPEFHSFESGKKFDTCLICQKNLLEHGQIYFVEKAFQKDEVLFEYAICMECREELQQDISEESMRKIQQYFEKNIDLVGRRKALLEKHRLDHRPWIDQCLITGKRRQDADQYQIITLCDGSDMLFSYLPYMISGEAMRKLTKLLSKTTRERLDDFVDEFLGLPPEVKDLDLVLI